jgi:hypothetical protein
MPSFVIVKASGRIGETIDAVICDLNAIGHPDRPSATPIRVQLLSERTLCVDGEPRGIISDVGENGVSTFLIDGSSKRTRNGERRVALAQASAHLAQLAAYLRPLIASSEEPELATEALGATL